MDKSSDPLLGVAAGSAPLTVIAPSWASVSLEQSMPLPLLPNDLTLAFESNVDLPSGSVITLTGLHGLNTTGVVVLHEVPGGNQGHALFGAGDAPPPQSSLFSSLLSLVVSSAPADVDPGRLVNETLVMPVGANRTVRAGVRYRLRVCVSNPPAPQPSPAVSVSVSGPVPVPPAPVGKGEAAVLGVNGGGEPLHVHAAAWVHAAAGQATFFPGAVNTISVTLQANFELPAGTVVVVGGLTGSPTPDGPLAVATEPAGVLATAGAWLREKGELRAVVARPWSRAVVRFNLTNPDGERAAAAASAAALSADGVAVLPPEPLAPPGGWLLGVAGGADPLAVILPAFLLAEMAQSVPLAGSGNSLLLTLAANVDLGPGCHIALAGLNSARLAEGALSLTPLGPDLAGGALDPVPLAVEPRHPAAPTSLVLSVAAGRAAVRAGVSYRLDLQVVNPSAAQFSPAISISALGGVGILARAVAKGGADAMGVAGGAQPLQVIAPLWTRREVGQVTFLPGAANTVSVTLQANFELPLGALVVVGGLTGSPTPDGELAVESSPKHLFSENRGSWDQGGGQLRLTVAGEGEWWAAGVVVSFDLTNPLVNSDSPSVFIRAEWATGAAMTNEMPMKKSPAPLLGVAGGSEPLFVLEPAITSATLGQSSPLPSALNTLTLTVSANIDLEGGSKVLLSGMAGASRAGLAKSIVALPQPVDGDTADSLSLPLKCRKKANTAKQDGGCDTFVFGVEAGQKLSAGVAYVIRFEVLNPPAAQPSPSVQIQVKGPVHIRATDVIKAVSSALGVTEGSQPLYVIEPAWIRKDVGQATFLPGAINTISATLQANFELPPGIVVVIGGLTGSETADGDLTVMSSPSGVIAAGAGLWRWAQETGELRMTVGSSDQGAWVSGVVIELNMTNPSKDRGPADVLAGIELDVGKILVPMAVMSTKAENALGVVNVRRPLFVHTPRFLAASIGQSSPLALDLNSITITLSTNIDLLPGCNISVTGLVNVGVSGRVTLFHLDEQSDLDIPFKFQESGGGLLAGLQSLLMFQASETGPAGFIDGDKLILTVADNSTVSANQVYIFCFNITNPAVAQPSQSISIEASGAVSILADAMERSTPDAAGIKGGGEAFFVVLGAWTVKDIGQSTFLPQALNIITCTLQVNFLLPAGTTVTLAGLIGAETVSGEIAVSTQPADSLNGQRGVWNKDKGEVSLALESESNLWMDGVVLEFTLKNPSSEKQPSNVTVISRFPNSARVLPETRLSNSQEPILGVLKGAEPLFVIRPRFSTAAISQSTPLCSAENVITLSLVVNVDIGFRYKILLTGFGGASLKWKKHVVVCSQDAELDSNCSEKVFRLSLPKASKEADKPAADTQDRLILRFREGSSMLAGVTYHVKISLTNPPSPQPAAAVRIALAGPIEMPPVPCALSSPDAFGVAGGGHPLHVIQPSWLRPRAGQATFLPGAVNTISVTLAANYELPAGTVVVVGGLVGSLMPDGDLSVVSKPPQLFSPEAGPWKQKKGELLLTVARDMGGWKTGVVVEFNLTNPVASRYSANVTVSAVWASGAAMIQETPASKSSTPLLGLASGSEPLFVLEPAITSAALVQSSPLPSALNTLTLTVSANIDLEGGSKVLLSGLVGVSRVGLSKSGLAVSQGLGKSERVSVSLSCEGVVAKRTDANEGRASGDGCETLALGVMGGQALRAGVEYVIQFEVTNPPTPQASPPIKVSASGAVKIPEKSVAKGSGTALGVTQGSQPLYVIEPAWTRKDVGQATFLPGAVNTISTTLQANFELPPGTVVVIGGLTGSETADGELKVSSKPQAAIHVGKGRWAQEVGELRVAISADPKGQADWMRVVVIEFDLTNPDGNRGPATPAVWALWKSGPALIPKARAEASTEPRLGVASGAAPLFVLRPVFLSASAGQASPLTGGPNTLSLTLSANVDLGPGCELSVAGLDGIGLDGTVSVLLSVWRGDAGPESGTRVTGEDGTGGGSAGRAQDDNDGAGAAGTGAGKMVDARPLDGSVSRGVLSVPVAAGRALRAAVVYVLRLDFNNPPQAQEPPAITVEAAGPVAVAAMAVRPSSEDAQGVPGGARPLLAIAPAWTRRDVAQAAFLPGAVNTISVTLQSNFELPAGTAVVLGGLAGAATKGGKLAVLVDPPYALQGGKGEWRQRAGQLRLTAGAAERGWVAGVTLRFNLTNPAAVGGPVNATVTVRRAAAGDGGAARALIPVADLTASDAPLLGVRGASRPLRVVAPALALAAMGQASPLAGASNELSLTFSANVDLEAGCTLTIAGLDGGSPATAAEAGRRGGGGSGVSAGTLCVATGPGGATAAECTRAEVWYDERSATGIVPRLGRLDAGARRVLHIPWRNPAAPQPPPSLSVSAACPAELGPVAVDASAAAALGVPSGASPLYVIAPAWIRRAVAQATFLPEAANTISATLQPNFELPAGTVVVVGGLTGSPTPDGPLAVVTEPAGAVEGDEGAWAGGAGELRLTVRGGAAGGWMQGVVVRFNLTNPPLGAGAAGAPGGATVRTEGPGAVPIPTAAAEHPPSLLGVAGGAAPLFVHRPALALAALAQRTPLAGAINTLALTLAADVDMLPGAVLSLTGLAGARTPPGGLALRVFELVPAARPAAAAAGAAARNGATADVKGDGKGGVGGEDGAGSRYGGGAAAAEVEREGLFTAACAGEAPGGCDAVRLSVAAGAAVRAGAAYVLRFRVVNPARAQPPPPVRAAVDGPAPVPPAPVESAGGDCAGVRGGCAPLRVVAPAWAWLG